MRPAEEQPAVSFGGLLRRLRTEARLTQEELAEVACLSPRSVSDLERGINRTAHKDTAILLADALNLAGAARELFVAAARGRAPASEALAAWQGRTPTAFAAAATRALPRDTASFTGRELELTRLNTAIPPAAKPSIFGLLGGDLAGFPNGRRVFDDVVSIELRAIAGVTFKLIDPHYTVDAAAGKLTDGLTPADVGTPFLRRFPYLGVPYDGFHHPHHPHHP
jgi:transcriptional regulator with XRE-family HTH domain